MEKFDIFYNGSQSTIRTLLENAYKQGWQDSLDNSNQTLQSIEYVDLGLESRTKWGKVEDYLNYAEAAHYNLPTKEQIRELFSNVKFKVLPRKKMSENKTLWEIQLEGPNGKRLRGFSFYVGEHSSNYDDQEVWIKESCVDENFNIEMARVLTAYHAGDLHFQKYSSRDPHLTLVVL